MVVRARRKDSLAAAHRASATGRAGPARVGDVIGYPGLWEASQEPRLPLRCKKRERSKTSQALAGGAADASVCRTDEVQRVPKRPGTAGPTRGVGPNKSLFSLRILERAKRFELSTPTLAKLPGPSSGGIRDFARVRLKR